MKFVRLHKLPEDHILRNTSVVGFASRTYECHGKGKYDWSMWKRVGADWPIASKTYNELGEVWKKKPISEWRPTKELEEKYQQSAPIVKRI